MEQLLSSHICTVIQAVNFLIPPAVENAHALWMVVRQILDGAEHDSNPLDEAASTSQSASESNAVFDFVSEYAPDGVHSASCTSATLSEGPPQQQVRTRATRSRKCTTRAKVKGSVGVQKRKQRTKDPRVAHVQQLLAQELPHVPKTVVHKYATSLVAHGYGSAAVLKKASV